MIKKNKKTSGMEARKRMSSARPALFSKVEVSSNSSMSEDILLCTHFLGKNKPFWKTIHNIIV